jgi:hypothetical protein
MCQPCRLGFFQLSPKHRLLRLLNIAEIYWITPSFRDKGDIAKGYRCFFLSMKTFMHGKSSL